jgi:hypothetical protein
VTNDDWQFIRHSLLVTRTCSRGVLAWTKAYTQSPAFKAEYDRQREQNRPPALKPKPSIDEELAQQKAERTKALEEMKKNVAQMNPDMRARMQDTVKQMEAQYAKMDADPKMAAMMRQSLEMQRAADEKSYQERVASFEKRFPADPKVLLVERINHFLDVSKDVDFGAQLVQDRNKKKFADPAYESKPETWKLCYRAGKDAVSAARTFATVWLRELQ